MAHSQVTSAAAVLGHRNVHALGPSIGFPLLAASLFVHLQKVNLFFRWRKCSPEQSKGYQSNERECSVCNSLFVVLQKMNLFQSWQQSMWQWQLIPRLDREYFPNRLVSINFADLPIVVTLDTLRLISSRQNVCISALHTHRHRKSPEVTDPVRAASEARLTRSCRSVCVCVCY